jgi:hypothetical protein
MAAGEPKKALHELERAYEDRLWFVPMLNVDPQFDPLRSEPRFQALIRRLNFPHAD